MHDYDEPPSVYSGHYEVEVVIDRPIAQVWKQYIDTASWVTTHDIENIHGEPGTVGSVTRVTFKRAKELGMPPPHFHYCRLIKVIPEKQWLLKTYAGPGGTNGVE